MTESILALARTLVGIPSQGGLDDPLPVMEALESWLADHGVPTKWLMADGNRVALFAEVGYGRRPLYCLNACLDTAPVGDVESWSTPPLDAVVAKGWLTGRGSADSKTGVAILAHLAVDLAEDSRRLDGTLGFLFDVDEHTGRFGGIKAYVAERPNLSGVMIGYPGNASIAVGARGFWRARLRTVGTGQHSGSRIVRQENAVVKAAALVQLLTEVPLPAEQEPGFDLAPKLTVTAIQGGEGYTSVPDACSVRVDVRLTAGFGPSEAEQLVGGVCVRLDEEHPTRQATTMEIEESWPAYRLPEDSTLAAALRSAAERIFGRAIPLAVAGPSNVGNYLASKGIPATCGFGVTYRNAHGSDERIDISTIEPVYETYRRAALDLAGSLNQA